jgi:GT2 family glycosyltransferase
LNNDTELDKECVLRLWSAMGKDPRIGATTPRILLYHQRGLLDAAGLTIYPDGLSIGRGRLEPHEKYNRMAEVFFGSGCASLYRKAMLEDVGLFDADFFAYAEDTDLGWRARLAGWKARYVPEAVVYHHHSMQVGTYSSSKAFLVERNRIWVAFKNFPCCYSVWPYYTLLRYFTRMGTLTQRGAPEDLERVFPSSPAFHSLKAF